MALYNVSLFIVKIGTQIGASRKNRSNMYNIDSDTRGFITCCPQFCVKTNNDELSEFELIELGNDSSEDSCPIVDANS